MLLMKSPGSTQRETPVFHPLRAAILEKMPLVERGGTQDEEAKESKEAQLSEAALVATEPQVRRPEAPKGRGLGLASTPSPAPSAFSPRPPSSWIC